MRTIIAVILLAASTFATQFIDDVTLNGTSALGLGKKTKAQLLAEAPARAGMLWYCSNCSITAVAISTGTAPGAVSDIRDRRAAVQ